jgi:hypothetical protein
MRGWLLLAVVFFGCAEAAPPPLINPPDRRETIRLAPDAQAQARAVMLQHLESVQQVVDALAREDFGSAQRLTEAHLGFFMHRQAMLHQKPEDFPPAYHDLAMAHHEAAEALARVMPTKDLKQILPKLDGVLRACVACHLVYKLG